MHPPRTLVEVLRRRAHQEANRTAFTYLVDGEREEETLTYGQLDREARAIGAQLQEAGATGRALLLYPPGLHFIKGLFGCWYGGLVAVPAYPPDPTRLGRTLPRLQRIAADAQVTVVLTTAALQEAAAFVGSQAPALGALAWVATDTAHDDVADWRDPGAQPETTALLQYTSGSTADPKGVVVTHANFLHNSRILRGAFGQDEDDVQVNWLPLYHDMGLMGGVLQALILGVPNVILSPLAFLEKPVRWLQAITRYRARTSGGPNFAYDLCVERTTPDQRAGLDLRSWCLAYNGAEPIRAATLERFARTFAPYGFRREAVYPCYGLAEATLIVAGGEKAAAPVLLAVDRRALGANVFTPPREGAAHRLVGCGRNVGNRSLLVVNPETRRACPPDIVGEIWVSGDSVAQGYWNHPEESARVFGARLADRDEGPFLRTGDLGFVHDGELFVTGRLKDLIIVRGENHYPQDLELSAEQSHAALRRGCGACFCVGMPGEEQLVIAYELDPRAGADPAEVVFAVRGALSEDHGLRADAVVLLEARTIPKTSSGKLQRFACRQAFLDGSLSVHHAWSRIPRWTTGEGPAWTHPETP